MGWLAAGIGTKPGYTFPGQVGRTYERLTDIDLMAALAKTIAGGFDASAPRAPKDYAAVREAFCGIAIELNIRQAFAPRFRSVPPLPWKPKLGDETVFALDMQVIDIHWRAHSRYKPGSPPRGYESLFGNAPFDYDTACRFALQPLPMDMKVADTKLTESMTREHAVLQPKVIGDLWRSIRDGRVRGAVITHLGAQHVEARLRESTIDQPHLASHVPEWVIVWTAYRFVGEKPSQVARMVGLMTGRQAPDPSAVAKKYAAAMRRLSAA